MIEDSERGLMAAKAAGVRFIVVPSELTRGSHLVGAYNSVKKTDGASGRAARCVAAEYSGIVCSL